MRSDREHCGSRVAVEQEDEEDNERRRRGEEEEQDQATDIKSNNPHLAGGEKTLTFQDIWYKGAELSCNPCSQEFGTCSGLSGGYCHEALHREQPRDFA